MTRLLVAVDPGGTTGLVVVDTDLTVHHSAEISQWWDVPAYVEELYLAYPDNPPLLVAERFQITVETAKKSPQSEPLDVLGALKYLHRKYTNKPLPLQTPADAKGFSTNDKLKMVNFWHKGGAGHANDAFRHALLYLVRENHIAATILLPKDDN